MKKKFLLYVVVIVTCLFLGFTIYYLARNDENIYLNISNDESIYINVNESIAWPVVWTKPYKDTKLDVAIGNEEVLSYDEQTQKFVGISGGFTSVTITPSNKNFGPFVFEVYVGDGKMGSPFMLKSAAELASIGVNPQFKTSMYYALANDIDMRAYNGGKWIPIDEFSGNFSGNGHTIYNLDIVDTANAGLFGSLLGSGVIENVKFAKVDINGSYDNVGVAAGINKGLIGKVEVVSGVITNTKDSSYTGAIAGRNTFASDTARINMCSSNVKISSNGAMGGIVGYNKSSIVLNCSAIVNEFNTTADGVVAGGIVGLNESSYDSANNQYYASAIAKCYVVIETVTGSVNAGGVVGKNVENNNDTEFFTNKFENVIYSTGDSLSLKSIAEGLSSVGTITNGEIKSASKSDLLVQDTYTNYNFDIVWEKETTNYANLNFNGSYETYVVKGLGVEINSDTVSLKSFLMAIKDEPSDASTYTVTKDTVVDLGGASWTTIAPDADDPLCASIIVEDGVTCRITNFKLEGANSSFFGYISGNTLIKGLTFDGNIRVDNSVEDNTAIVATGLINGATLEDITVKNITSFKTPANNVGLIVGRNEGTIKNSSASFSGNLVVPSSTAQKQVGGIAGYNAGYITNCTTSRFNLEINTKDYSSGNFNIGGICGLTETTISNNSVDSFNLETMNDGTMYVGGVVGYVTSGDIEIYKCYSKADINMGISNSNAYVGGVVAYSSSGTTISASVYTGGTLKAYNVGGLVGIHYGTLTSSWSGGELTGMNVAGLVNLCYNTVNNCYCESDLIGDTKNSIVSGVTSLVGPDCYIEKCLINASFSGLGEKYAESESPFRMLWIAKKIFSSRGDVDFGTVANLVIINYGNAKTQSSIFGIKKGWLNISDAECRGEDNYSALKEDAGFDSSIWDFGNVGEYPTLRDIAL